MKDITKNDIDFINEVKELNRIHVSWRDYALIMLNSTAEPLRSIWREKIVTSIAHWEFDKGSISEGNIAGMEILEVLPSELTEKLVDDHFEPGKWKKLGRLNGSKRMILHIGHYPQESTSNEANICLKYLVKNWDNVIYENLTGKDIIMNTPLLYRIWDFAQKSDGKCITGDEVLTYLLEKPLENDMKKYGVWMDAAEDIFENGIPSEKYKDYYKISKIEDYPLAYKDETGIADIDCNEENNFYMREYRNNNGSLEIIALPLEEQKQNFLNVCGIILKEDVSYCCCWKKICICILKNDVSFKYAGFGATLRERQARENAMAAFSTKQEEKEQAKKNAEALAAKIEKENTENHK